MTDIVRLQDPQLTRVPGFRAAGVACGLKKEKELDLALICADVPCTAAAVFTKNRVQAAPVGWDKSVLATGKPARAIVINSGLVGRKDQGRISPGVVQDISRDLGQRVTGLDHINIRTSLRRLGDRRAGQHHSQYGEG